MTTIHHLPELTTGWSVPSVTSHRENQGCLISYLLPVDRWEETRACLIMVSPEPRRHRAEAAGPRVEKPSPKQLLNGETEVSHLCLTSDRGGVRKRLRRDGEGSTGHNSSPVAIVAKTESVEAALRVSVDDDAVL